MTPPPVRPGRADGAGPPTGDLLLRNAMIIDGTGAPPYGPATVHVVDGRIRTISSGNDALTEVSDADGSAERGDGPERTGPAGAAKELDLQGGWLLPGLIDAHAHIGHGDQTADADYPYRLWLCNGITTVREAGALGVGLDFVAAEARRSAAHEILAPRIEPYVVFGQDSTAPLTEKDTIAGWIADVAARGAHGVKFFGAAPEPMRLALAEAAAAGLRTMCHHSQTDVGRVNARDTARWGLTSLEHGYGLPEAMLTTSRLPRYPAGYNYLDEHDRFAELGRTWAQAAAPGSPPWEALLDELVAHDLTLVPTFVAHLATRDLEHARGRRYHAEFTTARLQRFFTPGTGHHGSFFADWGTTEEAAWRQNYRRWMAFVHQFHLRGGRVCAGSDAGFIYNTYGFGLIEELELLCEAGWTPLEAIRSATLSAAELLGIAERTGSIEAGKQADLLVVEHNPLANLKVLSAAGHLRYRTGGEAEVVGGPRWTIVGGVVHDAPALAAQVRAYVAGERADGIGAWT